MDFRWDECETRTLMGVWDSSKGEYCNDWVRRHIKQLSGRGVSTHRAAAKESRAKEVESMVTDVKAGTFIAVNCGRDMQGFCYWLAKVERPPYKAVHDWTNHYNQKIKKGDLVIDINYYDRPSTDDPLLFHDEKQVSTVHAEHVLHADVAPAVHVVVEGDGDDCVRVSQAVCAAIEEEHEKFLNA